MPESLSRYWSGLGRPKVLVVGDLILDGYVYGDVERISPEAPIPVLSVTRREKRLGGAASVPGVPAAGVVSLGASLFSSTMISLLQSTASFE